AVSARRQFELQVEHEVAVLLGVPQVGVVTLPAAFAGPRLDRQYAIALGVPVAGRLPALQILAVEQRHKAVFIGGGGRTSIRDNGRSNGKQGQSEPSGRRCELHRATPLKK